MVQGLLLPEMQRPPLGSWRKATVTSSASTTEETHGSNAMTRSLTPLLIATLALGLWSGPQGLGFSADVPRLNHPSAVVERHVRDAAGVEPFCDLLAGDPELFGGLADCEFFSHWLCVSRGFDRGLMVVVDRAGAGDWPSLNQAGADVRNGVFVCLDFCQNSTCLAARPAANYAAGFLADSQPGVLVADSSAIVYASFPPTLQHALITVSHFQSPLSEEPGETQLLATALNIPDRLHDAT